MDGEIESREVTAPCRADKQQVQDINPNLYPQNTHVMGDRAINVYLGTFSLLAVFFFSFSLSFSQSLYPSRPTLTLFSLSTSVALGPATPRHLRCAWAASFPSSAFLPPGL